MKKTGVIKKAPQILLDGMETRFPISNLMIAAALLDPSIQHIEAVNDWLFENGKTRFEVLRDAMTELQIGYSEHQHEYQQQHEKSNNSSNIRLRLLKKFAVFTNFWLLISHH